MLQTSWDCASLSPEGHLVKNNNYPTEVVEMNVRLKS